MTSNDSIEFCVAQLNELPAILKLLLDDPLGKSREVYSDSPDTNYVKAFQEIQKDPHNEIIVGKLNGEVIATLQLTYIPNLTFQGSKRVQIEGVRVDSRLRGNGIGKKIFHYVFDRAKSKGCKIAQLTTNQNRPDALFFYKTLGFKPSHIGFKMDL